MLLTPDEIFKAKDEARRRFDTMSYEDNIAIVERLRHDLVPLRELREMRDAEADRHSMDTRPSAG